MSAEQQGAPEAAWASGDALRDFQNETRRLPGTALTAVAKMIGMIAPSLVELEAHAVKLREERDREAKLRNVAIANAEQLRNVAIANAEQLRSELSILFKRFTEERRKVRRLQDAARRIARRPNKARGAKR